VSVQTIAEVVVGVVVLGGVVACWVAAVGGAARHERAALREHVHATRAHFASVEAAEDNPSFSREAIERAVVEVVSIADRLWRAPTSRSVGSRPDAPLIRAWARSCQSLLGSGIEVTGRPSIDLLNVINRENEAEDRVVVRIRVRIHCKQARPGTIAGHHVHLDERWTFGRSGNELVLLSTEGDPLSAPIMDAPLIPSPSYDTARLNEESLAELATAQKVDDDVALSDLVGADEPASFALLDLSNVDNRFLPALIAAGIAHLLEAWESAMTGSVAPLEELTNAAARAALLRPDNGSRMVLRDAVLKSWEPTRLDLLRQPPAVEVTLEVEAVRYVVRGGDGAITGSVTDAHRMNLIWTFELTDSTESPWRLISSTNPAESIPGWRRQRP
jgi:hypothetical protein